MSGIRARLLTGRAPANLDDSYQNNVMEKAAVKKKRKRSVFTLEMKLSIIKELEKGSSQRAVGESFGVPKSTVADIWKDRNKIIDALASSVLPTLEKKKRCIVRLPNFDLVDESCWTWFCQQRSKGAPVSGVLLQEKNQVIFREALSRR